MRYLQLVHSLPDRTRLRCPAIRTAPDDARRLADELAATAGVHDVALRPFTGSILVTHDRSVTTATLIEIARRVLACERVLAPGEQPPDRPPAPEFARIAKLAASAFRDIDRDLLRASEGSIDLGTLATLGFFAAGAFQLALEPEVDIPPWFNLAWWGYRTFMTNEQAEIDSLDGEDTTD